MIIRAKELTLILVLSVPFLFWGIGSVDLLDPDEGLYGSIARQMAASGDWITLRFNGVRYLEKPPLYFWLTALTMSFFGPSEWAVRLWSAIPALGTALVTWRLGNLIYGRPSGPLSALIFVSAVGVFRYARVAATDFLLVFALTLAIYGFVKSYVSRKARHWPVVFWLGMTLGVLAKGLIGLVFPLLIIGLYLIALRLTSEGARWRTGPRPLEGHLVGFILFLILVLPWHILAAWRNPGFFHFYILDNQFLRFLSRRAFIEDDIPIGTLSFLIVTWIFFFPWSLFLPVSVRYGFARLKQSPDRLLIGLWAVVVLGFFSVSTSKLEHYFLPAVPALSLMVGALWAGIVQAQTPIVNPTDETLGQLPLSFEPRSFKRWFMTGAVGCVFVGIGLLLFSDRLTPGGLLAGLAELNVYYRILQAQGQGLPFESVSPFVGLLINLGLALALALPAAFLAFQYRLPVVSLAFLLALAGVIRVLVIKLDHIVEAHHSSRPMASVLVSQAGARAAIVHEGSLEYSAGLPFYTGRELYLLNGKRGDLDFGSRYPETRHLYLDAQGVVRMWRGAERVFLVTRYPRRTSVLNELPEEDVFPLGHYGSRWLYTNHETAHRNP